MSIPRSPSGKNHPDPNPRKHAALSASAAAHIVSALVAGEPEAADRLAALLVLLEADLIRCSEAGPALENITTLLEMAYQQSDSYRVSLGLSGRHPRAAPQKLRFERAANPGAVIT